MVILFAVGFGLDLLNRVAASGNSSSSSSSSSTASDPNDYILEDGDNDAEETFDRHAGTPAAALSQQHYAVINAAHNMQTNYVVSAVFLVCSTVTLLFAAIRLYLFPYALGKDNVTNAPEAQLLRTLSSRSGAWYEIIWKVITSSRAIFDDVCVFVVALVLTLHVVGNVLQ